MDTLGATDANLLYRCLKKSNNPRQMGQLCQWHDSIFDYVAHLNENHKESCFKSAKRTVFYWKIPLSECTDKGLIKHKSQSYLYEIYYKKNPGDECLYFCLTGFRGHPQRYRFRLNHKNLSDHCVPQQTMPNLTDVSVPICERKWAVAIPSQILSAYCDASRRIDFKIIFDE
jgi:hypothetical protein